MIYTNINGKDTILFIREEEAIKALKDNPLERAISLVIMPLSLKYVLIRQYPGILRQILCYLPIAGKMDKFFIYTAE